MSDKRIGVVGLGKLGLPFAVSWAERGFKVSGVDLNEERILAVNKGNISDSEPGLKEALIRNLENVTATDDLGEVFETCDAIFILVNTPGEASGKFTNRYVLAVCEELKRLSHKIDARPLIVLASSVTPGSIENEIMPVLGDKLELVYSPVFIALGNQLSGYVRPDVGLIGEGVSRAGDRLEKLLRDFYVEDIPIIRTNFVNAEIIKLVLSTFITTKIVYANMLAEMCDNLPGANSDVVAEAIGLDSRVSPKALRGGMPFGGPCFPRDNRALLYLASQLGFDGQVVQATDSFNRRQIENLGRRVLERINTDDVVTVLGLAFKPGSDVVDESTSLDLANYLTSNGANVKAYDPVAMTAAKDQLGEEIELSPDFITSIKGSNVIVVATPWDEFRLLPKLLMESEKTVVIDPWRLFMKSEFSANVEYIAIGQANIIGERHAIDA